MAGLPAAALLGDLLHVGDDLRHVRVAVDVDRVGAVDVRRALVGDVGQPARRIDAELLEERLGVLVTLGLGLLLRLLVALQELLVQSGADLVGLALVLDVGVVLGGDQAAVEVEALAGAGGAHLGRQIELGKGFGLLASAWNGPSIVAFRLPDWVPSAEPREVDREMTAGDLGRVVEGLLENLVRVLVVAAAAASAAGDGGRDRHERSPALRPGFECGSSRGSLVLGVARVAAGYRTPLRNGRRVRAAQRSPGCRRPTRLHS